MQKCEMEQWRMKHSWTALWLQRHRSPDMGPGDASRAVNKRAGDKRRNHGYETARINRVIHGRQHHTDHYLPYRIY